MKKIFLVRHAKAEKRNFSQIDFERKLTARGEADALFCAGFPGKSDWQRSRLISSHAPRALQTAEIFARQGNYDLNAIGIEEMLYEDPDIPAMLQIIRKLPEEIETLMIFGHNPFMTDFAVYLCPAIFTDLPTAGIVGLAFEGSWKGIQPQTMQLQLFEFPTTHLAVEDLRGAIRKEFSAEIAQNVQAFLEKYTTEISMDMKKSIGKAADKIAAKFMDTAKAHANMLLREKLLHLKTD